ncbi:hypothetical protein ACFY93_13305 [Streptomyces sp. NPDC008313]|uniref:hypothetical protein n=1 Tax=Streptomyces sp. NPDC008313 TaxID=3364826 RepID=UPI0036E12DBB
MPTHWPAGIGIKAAFALAPTSNWDNEPVTKTPFAVMWGTCDAVNTGSYFEDNRDANRAPLYKYAPSGGNHDYYNRQWSPSSGQVAAHDDAQPGTRPGTCASQYYGQNHPQVDQPRLGEHDQRLVTEHRVTAFFERFLQSRAGRQPYLTGERPFHGERAGATDSAYDSGS